MLIPPIGDGSLHHILLPENGRRMGKSTRNTKNIVPPVFADTVYDVTDYGAKSDTTFDSRPAILQAISHCNTNGGGTVLIPAGNYFIKGAITLKSNINLHIAEGARLEFSTEAADYLPMVLTNGKEQNVSTTPPLSTHTNVRMSR